MKKNSILIASFAVIAAASSIKAEELLIGFDGSRNTTEINIPARIAVNLAEEPETPIRYRPQVPDFNLKDFNKKPAQAVEGQEKDDLTKKALDSADIKTLMQKLGLAMPSDSESAWKSHGENTAENTGVSFEVANGRVMFMEYTGQFGKRTNAIFLPENHGAALQTINGKFQEPEARLNCPDCVVTNAGAFGSYPGTAPGVDPVCYGKEYAACKASGGSWKVCAGAAALSCATPVPTCIDCGGPGM